MFKVERIQTIKEIIFERKQIDVSTLSTLLNVSDATIRNDLEELEKQGYLTRFHGGATLNSINTKEEINDAFNGNTVKYDKNKEEIGIMAANLVSEKEWVFLGPGTTCYYIAKALAHRNNMNVMTNNLLAANILSNNASIQTLVLGGRLNTDGLYALPDDISRELQNIYLSKSFFSIDGADMDSGYTLSDLDVLDIIKIISQKCKETIFAVDCAKFGHRSFMKLGDLDFAQVVVTNDNVPPQFKKYYLEHGVCTYTCAVSLCY